ncbi:MAG: potassium channel family protein [Planctomycetota bacterium]
MIVAIAIGIALTVVSIAVHATGTALLIRRLRQLRWRNEQNKRTPGTAATPHDPVGDALEFWTPSFRRHVWTLAETATVLLLFQLAEVVIWAIVYHRLPDDASPGTFEDSVYFSFVTFTTLGYGDLVLTGHWRILSAIQAAAGVLICGWSTAILFAVVQAIWSDRPR